MSNDAAQNDVPEAERFANLIETQNRIKERFPTPGSIDKALDRGWASRYDAIQMLGYLGQDDRALAVALADTDAPALVEHVLKLIVPAPVKLVVHSLTMKHGQARTTMCYTLVHGNYLHAESDIVGIVGKSPARVPAPILEAFGCAGLRSAAPMLRKHAKLTRLRTYAQAVAEGDGKDKPSNTVAAHSPERAWDAPTERAIESLVALRRLDADVDVDHVDNLRGQVYTAMTDHRSVVHLIAWSKLTWVLFDAGVDACYDELMAAEWRRDVVLDIAATLLKRDDTQRLAQYLPSIASEARSPTKFCTGRSRTRCTRAGSPEPNPIFAEGYSLARDAGVAPPWWWAWQSPWGRSSIAGGCAASCSSKNRHSVYSTQHVAIEVDPLSILRS